MKTQDPCRAPAVPYRLEASIPFKNCIRIKMPLSQTDVSIRYQITQNGFFVTVLLGGNSWSHKPSEWLLLRRSHPLTSPSAISTPTESTLFPSSGGQSKNQQSPPLSSNCNLHSPRSFFSFVCFPSVVITLTFTYTLLSPRLFGELTHWIDTSSVGCGKPTRESGSWENLEFNTKNTSEMKYKYV